MENPNFLKNKYNLHNSEEVKSAARRTEIRTGEKVAQDPASQIDNYLNRFREIIDRKEPYKREQGIEAIKKILHDKFVIKPEDIPESYFVGQQRIAREQGHGDIEITDDMREQLSEVIITDQKSSLDNWIDYLSSDDATYPDWLKYYAFRSILSMGEYDKDKKQFTKRSKGTTKPFPDINREALAYVLDAVNKKANQEEINLPTANEEDNQEFNQLLQGENFAKLYAFAIDKITPTEESELSNIKGEWVKYRQGKDHMPLVNSLQGYGTGWCTAGESTAKTQLANGDFYVYYSLDKDNKPNIPRAAIRMQGDSIAEVRGIGPDQNLDPHINDVVKTKLTKFPDGEAYEKKSNDMKFLTEIEKKTKASQPLTKDELIFLYEINDNIEGFGYQRDPRIKELLDQRNKIEDAPIILDCQPNQIAHNQTEVNKDTKAYIGPLFPNIFKLPNLEYIYTSFPEGKLEKYNIEIGNKTKDELEQELEKQNVYVSNYAKDLLNSKDFTITKTKEKIDLIRLTVKDLGFTNTDNSTTDNIYKKAQELGLELCPSEVGPQLRLQNKTKNSTLIAMKQILNRRGDPEVFFLYWDGEQLRLGGSNAESDRRWYLVDELVFCSRK